MVSFRKWFPALAIVALLLGSAVAASAQTAFTCQVSSSNPPLVRVEGLSELVGDIVLQCTGGTTTAASQPVPGVNITLFLDTYITSKVLNSSGLSEALLLIDEPSTLQDPANPDSDPGQALCPGICTIQGVGTAGFVNPGPGYVNGYAPGTTVPGGVGYKNGTGLNGTRIPNMYQAKFVQQTVGGVTTEYLSWTGIPLDAPGTTGIRTLRITNVRANANFKGLGSPFSPNYINASLAINSTQSITVTNPVQRVAVTARGLGEFGVVKTANFLQCNGNELGTTSFSARFTEGFASSFKRIAKGGYTDAADNGDGTAMLIPPQPVPPNTAAWAGYIDELLPQNIPGQTVYTESGFVFDPASGVGVATNGTRLMLRLGHIPTGATVYAGVWDSGASDVTTARARLISTNAAGAGAVSFVDPTDGNMVEVPSNGILVYEIVASDPAVIDKIDIPFTVVFDAADQVQTPDNNLPTITGALAPLSSVKWESIPSVKPPIPRFFDTPIDGGTPFIINPCRTNILFPFVTNQLGYDTGIAISNTSRDIFGTPRQQGNCTLNFFGAVSGGGTAPAPIATTSVVEAGSYFVYTLSNGGNLGTEGRNAAGFQGYIIAQCDFQYAHGFAFISDLGSQKFAEGYLGLILDKPIMDEDGRTGRTTYSGESLDQ